MCLCLGKQDWWGGDICDEKSRGWRWPPMVEFKVILQNIATAIWISFACFWVELELVLELTFTKTMIEESGWADTNNTPGEAMRSHLKVVSSSDIIKTLKARSHILKPGSRGLLKCKVTILYPFSYISSTLHIARIVYNIIEITLISFKLNINHLSLPLTKNCYDLIENRKYCRLKIYIWSQSTLPILLSTP